jgi:hypothetical protein
MLLRNHSTLVWLYLCAMPLERSGDGARLNGQPAMSEPHTGPKISLEHVSIQGRMGYSNLPVPPVYEISDKFFVIPIHRFEPFDDHGVKDGKIEQVIVQSPGAAARECKA